MSDHHIIKLTPTKMSKHSHEVSAQCKLESVGAPSKFTVLHFGPEKTLRLCTTSWWRESARRNRF